MVDDSRTIGHEEIRGAIMRFGGAPASADKWLEANNIDVEDVIAAAREMARLAEARMKQRANPKVEMPTLWLSGFQAGFACALVWRT